MQNKSRVNIRTMVSLALLIAIAYAVTFLSKLIPINVAGFLNMDLKDVVIVIGGFIFGPISVAAMSIIVSLIEMFTISATGIIGFFMNVVSTCVFGCVAAAFYKKNRTMKSAVAGLIAACLSVTAVMLLWNYIITPFYMSAPGHVGEMRTEIAKMLVPVFLPFNLLKYGINAAFAVLLYKPVVGGLRKAKLVPEQTGGKAGRISWGMIAAAVFALATFAALFLVLAKVI